jgi:dipeptidyl aminopeptidase/acylaminoacyl peptidase
MVDLPPSPRTFLNEQGDKILFLEYQANPPIALVSRPIERLAGLRIDPALNARQRLNVTTGYSVLHIRDGKTVRIKTPKSKNLGVPKWSLNGERIAFSVDTDNGVELWTAEVSTGEAKRIKRLFLNDITMNSYDWLPDNKTLLCRTVPSKRGAIPQRPRVPAGPNVQETAGKFSKLATYQDLLRTPDDERLFEYFATSQPMIVDIVTGTVKPYGKSSIFLEMTLSPDGKYFFITRIKKTFSYRVEYDWFSRSMEIWDRMGNIVKVIADLPVSDEVPPQGVTKGPREVVWQPFHPARLLWIEALDGGDPMKKVPFRDRLMRLEAPFKTESIEAVKLQHRFSGMTFCDNKDQVLISEYARERRWNTTTLHNLTDTTSAMILFDLSANDAYNNPGSPITYLLPDGQVVMKQKGDWAYFAGRGASPKGNMPFLDMINLKTKEKKRLFRSTDSTYEQFMGYMGEEVKDVIIRKESKTEPPNLFKLNLETGERKALTFYQNPYPQLKGMRKQLLTYNRADGVPLSGTLYLPPEYKTGEKIPVIIWAYPLEYSDAGTAGQVRGTPNAFTFIRGASILFFITQGYAVLMDATMPIVGDPETMNDTFVDQIVGSAWAAIHVLDSMGIADTSKIVVSGHSYGAFMTANLLAHSNLFAAGIARSGAYNRTLTPFGFQSERRSFWEARDVYIKMSPFSFADHIKSPLLMIHGEMDNNSGTFPIQSERLFEAIQANGGTARLVMLPYESHGYSARESILHVLAEMFDWCDKYVKKK